LTIITTIVNTRLFWNLV